MVDGEIKPNETGKEADKETRDSDKNIKAYAQKFAKRMTDTSNILTLFFSLCLVVAAFLTFLAICVQAFIYNAQLREMKKSTDAATKAAKSAEDSVAQARETTRLDQRAWVVTAGINGFPEAGHPFRVKVIISNTGKTPAKNLDPICASDPVERGNLPNFQARLKEVSEKHRNEEGSKGFLPPNGRTETTLEPKTEQIFSDENITALKNGNPRYFLYGEITYEDIFDQPHLVDFLYNS